ncbi:MAG TPA: hypothetical protein DIU37_01555 [Opitutae bacterium]|nr:hypothetical protein [Opitutae bacterium]|tara:strand:+ start:3215 stop:3829 length:615 start_codon:yes stop_codon:yes gene_type:complete
MSNFLNISGDAILSKWHTMSAQLVEQVPQDASSEAGQIGLDIASVIGQWEDQLNSDLQNWYDTTQQMSTMIDNAQYVVHEVKAFYTALQNYPDGMELNTTNYDRLTSVMTRMGIPQSQWAQVSYQNGYYYFSATDMQQEMDVLVEYAKMDSSKFQNDFSQLQQQTSKEMLAVMYDTTAIKQNQQALSGLWSALKQMAQNIEQNI